MGENNPQQNEIPKTINNLPTARISKSQQAYYRETFVQGFDGSLFKAKNGWDKIRKMLTDDQVYPVLEMKKLYTISSNWQIITENEEQKEFIINNLNNLNKFNFSEVLYNMLSSYEYGFSLNEIIYKLENQYYNVDRIMPVFPESVEFIINDDTDNVTIEQNTSSGKIIIPEWKTLLYRRGTSFNNPYGNSDLEKCYKAYYLKDFVYKQWGIYLERYATPTPVGKVPSGYETAQSSKLLKILESIRASGAILVPDEVTLEFLEVQKASGDEFKKCIDQCNQAIARALLCPDLLGFGGGQNTGSYALGKEQFALFYKALEFDRKKIADLISDNIIRPLIDINFGKQEEYPYFEFCVDDKEAKQKMFENWKIMVDVTRKVTLEDINYFREFIGLQPLEESDMVPEQPAPIPPTTPEEPKEDDDNGDMMPDDEKEEEAPKDKEEFASTNKELKPKRSLNKYEKRINFMSKAKVIDTKEKYIIDEMANYFSLIKNKLKKDIATKGIVENKKYDQVQKLQLGYLGDLKEFYTDSLKELYGVGVKDAYDELEKLQPAKFAKTDDLTTLGLTTEKAIKIADDYINELTFQSIGKFKDDILNKAKDSLIQGIAKGKSTKDIMNDIDVIFNPFVSGSAGAGMSSDPFLLETIIRTNMTDLYNTAKSQVARDPENDYIWGYEYSAILDDRTSDICDSLDGKIAPKDDPIWDSITPPNHFNCRSQLIYITQDDVKDDNLEPSKFPSEAELEASGGKGFV